MVKRSWVGSFSGVALTGALIMSFAEQHAQTSSFNPGIHPAAPASIAAEQSAENAWFGHVKVLAGDDLKGRKQEPRSFCRQWAMSKANSRQLD